MSQEVSCFTGGKHKWELAMCTSEVYGHRLSFYCKHGCGEVMHKDTEFSKYTPEVQE